MSEVSGWVVHQEGNKDFVIEENIHEISDATMMQKIRPAINRGIQHVSRGGNSAVHLTVSPKCCVPNNRFEEIQEMLEAAGFDSSQVPFFYKEKRKMIFTKEIDGEVYKLTIKTGGHSAFLFPKNKDDSFESVEDLTQQIGHLKMPSRGGRRGVNKENRYN